MVILNIYVSIYYNVIIAYTVFYFFASLTPKLPWETCDAYWNTAECSTTFCEFGFGLTSCQTAQCDFLVNQITFTAELIISFME